MTRLLSIVAALAVLSPSAAPGALPDKCLAKVNMAGKQVVLTHCAVAFYGSERSVTLWLTERPLAADLVSNFQWNSAAKDRDASGKPISTMHLSFCPGGGEAGPSPDAVHTVEMRLHHASSPALFREWAFELPEDAGLKVERLFGTLRPGGRLVGKVLGAKKSDGQPYSWEVDFDVAIPAKTAAAGMSCGDSSEER